MPKFRKFFIERVFRWLWSSVAQDCATVYFRYTGNNDATSMLKHLDFSPDLFQAYGNHSDTEWVGMYATFTLIPMSSLCKQGVKSNAYLSELLRCADQLAAVRR